MFAGLSAAHSVAAVGWERVIVMGVMGDGWGGWRRDLIISRISWRVA